MAERHRQLRMNENQATPAFLRKVRESAGVILGFEKVWFAKNKIYGNFMARNGGERAKIQKAKIGKNKRNVLWQMNQRFADKNVRLDIFFEKQPKNVDMITV